MTPHEPHTMKCEATVTYSGLSQHTYLINRHNHLIEGNERLLRNHK